MSANRPVNVPEDPLIDEVRAIRRAISEQCANDVDRLCDHLQELERQHPERIAQAARNLIDRARRLGD